MPSRSGVAGVDHLSQQEQLSNSLAATIRCLPSPVDRPAPTKHLVDAFALALADGEASPARCAAVNRGAAGTRIVLCHVRRRPIDTARRD